MIRHYLNMTNADKTPMLLETINAPASPEACEHMRKLQAVLRNRGVTCALAFTRFVQIELPHSPRPVRISDGQRVVWAEEIAMRDCRFGECDEGRACGRHKRARQAADRLATLKEKGIL